MTPMTIQGVTLYAVQSIPAVFDCYKCVRYNLNSCVRINSKTNELYFDGNDRVNEVANGSNRLWCIVDGHDMVFINNTPEDIARYVAARLEAT